MAYVDPSIVTAHAYVDGVRFEWVKVRRGADGYEYMSVVEVAEAEAKAVDMMRKGRESVWPALVTWVHRCLGCNRAWTAHGWCGSCNKLLIMERDCKEVRRLVNKIKEASNHGKD